MSILQIALLGFFGGTMTTTGIFLWLNSKDDSEVAIIDNQNKVIQDLANIQATLAKGDQEIQKQLTSTDLLVVSCSEEWMADHGDLLCREMFCRLQTREGDAASQSECEIIGNLANSFTLIESCQENKLDLKTCIEVVDRRK
jgi:hypothetical protein